MLGAAQTEFPLTAVLAEIAVDMKLESILLPLETWRNRLQARHA
jgi:hypothetical protein